MKYNGLVFRLMVSNEQKLNYNNSLQLKYDLAQINVCKTVQPT